MPWPCAGLGCRHLGGGEHYDIPGDGQRKGPAYRSIPLCSWCQELGEGGGFAAAVSSWAPRKLRGHSSGLGVLRIALARDGLRPPAVTDTLTWGSAELLRMATPPAEPTIAYTGKAETWLPRL